MRIELNYNEIVSHMEEVKRIHPNAEFKIISQEGELCVVDIYANETIIGGYDL